MKAYDKGLGVPVRALIFLVGVRLQGAIHKLLLTGIEREGYPSTVCGQDEIKPKGINQKTNMKYTKTSILLVALASFANTLVLIGCGAVDANRLPEVVENPRQNTSPEPITGSVFGGHAPLVGAHVYLVQPGTAGYGSVVYGLLTATTSVGGYPTTENGSWPTTATVTTGTGTVPGSGYNSDQFVPATDGAGNPFYGVTTDANGAFALGGYSCTVGRPVILIAYGGSPSFGGGASATTNVFSLASATLVLNTPTTGTGQFTYTTTSPELFYVGEPVAITGYPAFNSGLNQSGTVIAGSASAGTSLTTTRFTIQVPYTGGGAGTYTGNLGGNPIVTATPEGNTAAPTDFNPAAVNVAVLGNCPSAGNFYNGSTALKFVYLNEVATTAFGYAMNQFGNWTVNDQSGNDEFHIGSPSTPQALQGIANAAIIAGNLYDIQGGNESTSFQGEGHIARSVTVTGAGIVPQNELDTIANILAACVDSNNTYRRQVGTVSAQCNVLETHATDNGVYDSTTSILTGTESHVAFNIAQAVMNIAHYPQGRGTGTSSNGIQTITSTGNATTAAAFVSALYNLPTGSVPFTPNLSSEGVGQPNDFSIGINWQTSPYARSGTETGSTTNYSSLGEMVIDSIGNAWATVNADPGNGSSVVLKLTPVGLYTTYQSVPFTAVGTTPIAGLAFDTSNNLFISSTAGVQELTAASSYASGGIIGYNVTANSGAIAVDNSGFLYVANLNEPNPPANGSGGTGSSLVKEPSTINSDNATIDIFSTAGGGTANTPGGCVPYLGYLTLDSNNNIWTSNQNTAGTPYATVCRFNNSGTLQYSHVLAGNGNSQPDQIAIDAGGNAWFADQLQNDLIEVLANSTNPTTSNGTANTFTPATGVLNAPMGVAIDGANTVWVTNSGTGAISQFSTSGTSLSPTYYIGSGFNTVTGGGHTSGQFVAVDPSGNVWSVDSAHGQLIEYVGVGSPTVQPLAQARAGTAGSTGHGIGQKP